jgi:putative endonuclease
VFVEVKSRTGGEFGGAAAAVTGRKQRRITNMAIDYLSRHRLHDCPVRFDVVAIEVVDGATRVDVYPHAFESAY